MKVNSEFHGPHEIISFIVDLKIFECKSGRLLTQRGPTCVAIVVVPSLHAGFHRTSVKAPSIDLSDRAVGAFVSRQNAIVAL